MSEEAEDGARRERFSGAARLVIVARLSAAIISPTLIIGISISIGI